MPSKIIILAFKTSTLTFPTFWTLTQDLTQQGAPTF